MATVPTNSFRILIRKRIIPPSSKHGASDTITTEVLQQLFEINSRQVWVDVPKVVEADTPSSFTKT